MINKARCLFGTAGRIHVCIKQTSRKSFHVHHRVREWDLLWHCTNDLPLVFMAWLISKPLTIKWKEKVASYQMTRLSEVPIIFLWLLLFRWHKTERLLLWHMYAYMGNYMISLLYRWNLLKHILGFYWILCKMFLTCHVTNIKIKKKRSEVF